VAVGVAVADGVRVGVDVLDGVEVLVADGDGVGVDALDGVAVAVADGDGVGVDVLDGVALVVADGDGVGVDVCVIVGEESAMLAITVGTNPGIAAAVTAPKRTIIAITMTPTKETCFLWPSAINQATGVNVQNLATIPGTQPLWVSAAASSCA
jgi:hypothetical protein